MEFIIIENDIEKIRLFQSLGIQHMMIDLEKYRKEERQKGLDTVKSNHSINDISSIKRIQETFSLYVRVDQINSNSKEQINDCINAGADTIMLPYFEVIDQVKEFLSIISGRVKTCLLFETINSIKNIDEITNLNGIDEIHFGLNDLSIQLKESFMLKILVSGYLDNAIAVTKSKKIPFGIGGVAPINQGLIKGKYVIASYISSGAKKTILSRDFKNLLKFSDQLFSKEYSQLLSFVSNVEPNPNHFVFLKDEILKLTNNDQA